MHTSVHLCGCTPHHGRSVFCDQAETAQASDSTLAEKGTLKEITALEAQLKRQIDMVSDRMMSLSSQYGNFDLHLLPLFLFLFFFCFFFYFEAGGFFAS